MANFTITVNEYTNESPNQIGITTIGIDYGEEYIFTIEDFTTESIPEYSDPEGDPLSKIKILTLPSTGTSYIEFDGTPVNIDDEISVDDIEAGLLRFITDEEISEDYEDSFTYDVADTGSEEFGNLTGIIQVSVDQEVNQPPTEVGDGEATIDYGETLVFTREMFTTQTEPPYDDPEDDAALLLKITQLPNDGEIRLNNQPIEVNEIITFEDIDDGLLTYVHNEEDIDGDMENFQFQIADAGSGQFVG